MDMVSLNIASGILASICRDMGVTLMRTSLCLAIVLKRSISRLTRSDFVVTKSEAWKGYMFDSILLEWA